MSSIKRLHFLGREWRDVRIARAEYANGTIAASLWDTEYQEPLAVMTVALDAYGLVPAEGCFFVKGYSEGEGLADALVEAGVVERTGRTVTFGPYDGFAEECRFVGRYA